jgi:hypothetical protein
MRSGFEWMAWYRRWMNDGVHAIAAEAPGRERRCARSGLGEWDGVVGAIDVASCGAKEGWA